VPDRIYLNERQDTKLAEVVRWYDRIGRRLRLHGPPLPPREPLLCSDRRFKGFLQGAMTSTNATHTVYGVVRITGASPTASSSEEVTVWNPHGWDGDDDAVCRAEWVAGSSHWEFYQVSCPAST
jgi:hypothetical protein